MARGEFEALKKAPESDDIRAAVRELDDLSTAATMEEFLLIVRERLNHNYLQSNKFCKCKIRIEGREEEKFLHEAVDAYCKKCEDEGATVVPLIREAMAIMRGCMIYIGFSEQRDALHDAEYYWHRARADENKPVQQMLEVLRGKVVSDAVIVGGRGEKPSIIETKEAVLPHVENKEMSESENENSSVNIKEPVEKPVKVRKERVPSPQCAFCSRVFSFRKIRLHEAQCRYNPKSQHYRGEKNEAGESQPEVATSAGKFVEESRVESGRKLKASKPAARGRPRSSRKKRGD